MSHPRRRTRAGLPVDRMPARVEVEGGAGASLAGVTAEDRGEAASESRGLNAPRRGPRLVEPMPSREPMPGEPMGRREPMGRGEPMPSRSRGEDGQVVDVEQVRSALESHRALLVEVDAGRVEASGVQRAYVAGAADVLARLVDGDLDVTPSTDSPRATPDVPRRDLDA